MLGEGRVWSCLMCTELLFGVMKSSRNRQRWRLHKAVTVVNAIGLYTLKKKKKGYDGKLHVYFATQKNLVHTSRLVYLHTSLNREASFHVWQRRRRMKKSSMKCPAISWLRKLQDRTKHTPCASCLWKLLCLRMRRKKPSLARVSTWTRWMTPWRPEGLYSSFHHLFILLSLFLIHMQINPDQLLAKDAFSLSFGM